MGVGDGPTAAHRFGRRGQLAELEPDRLVLEEKPERARRQQQRRALDIHDVGDAHGRHPFDNNDEGVAIVAAQAADAFESKLDLVVGRQEPFVRR